MILRLLPLQTPLPLSHPDSAEQGQLFEQYIRFGHFVASGRRRILYLIPIGRFRNDQINACMELADWLEIFSGLRVQLLQGKTTDELPAGVLKRDSRKGDSRIGCQELFQRVLLPCLPKDAFGIIALTPLDLSPGPEYQHAFGITAFRERVGVISLYYPRSYSELLKIASHETCHLFSLPHCNLFPCLMNRTETMKEITLRPMFLCPDCMAKLAWSAQISPVIGIQERYDFLKEFLLRLSLVPEANRAEELSKAVRTRWTVSRN